MIFSLLIASALQIAIPSQDKGSDCPQSAASESRLSECAHQNYLNADQGLNKQWRRMAAVVRPLDVTAFTHLLDAQRAWLRYREETCAGSNVFLGGAAASHNYFDCMTEMTGERIAELNRLIELWRTASRRPR